MIEVVQAFAAVVTVVFAFLAIRVTNRQFKDQAAAEERRDRSEYYGLFVRNSALEVVRELGNFLTAEIDPAQNPKAHQLELASLTQQATRVRMIQKRVVAAREATLMGAEAWGDPNLIAKLDEAFEAVEDVAVEEAEKVARTSEWDENRIRGALSRVLHALKEFDPALGKK